MYAPFFCARDKDGKLISNPDIKKDIITGLIVNLINNKNK